MDFLQLELYFIDEKVKIMFSNQYYIRLVDLHHNENLVANNLTNAVALDFHYNDSCIYWSDVSIWLLTTLNSSDFCLYVNELYDFQQVTAFGSSIKRLCNIFTNQTNPEEVF